jgi:hypothetical protein
MDSKLWCRVAGWSYLLPFEMTGMNCEDDEDEGESWMTTAGRPTDTWSCRWYLVPYLCACQVLCAAPLLLLVMVIPVVTVLVVLLLAMNRFRGGQRETGELPDKQQGGAHDQHP